MKTVYKYITCLTMAFVTISCIDDKADDVEGKRTRAGYFAYEFVKSSVLKQTELFTLALHADEYLQATTDEERIRIDDLYFSQHKIQHLNGVFIIHGMGSDYDHLSCKFDSNGKPINTINHTWTIAVLENKDYRKYSTIEYTIKCTEKGSYAFNGMIITDGYRGRQKNDIFDMTIQLNDNQKYTLSGKGKYSYNENEIGDYALSDVTINSNNTIVDGSFNISFCRTNESKYEKAVITIDQERGNSVKVEYRGLTEIWLPNSDFRYE